jgi:hypothetical protein
MRAFRPNDHAPSDLLKFRPAKSREGFPSTTGRTPLMNPKSYQPQNNPNSTRVRCPVCHEAVYSRAGIHPQCAVRQSEPPRSKTKPPEGSEEPIIDGAVVTTVEGTPAAGV